MPDLTQLTIVQLLSTLLLFTAVDTGFAYAMAIANKTFEADYALDFLRTHIMKIGLPILGLAILGNGIEGYVPPIPIAFAAAVASLGVYILTVLASLKDTLADKAVVPAATPVTEATG